MHKKVVLPDEIKSLRPLECYAKIAHHQPFKLHFDLSKRPFVNAPVQSKINKNYQMGQKHLQDDSEQPKTRPQQKWLPGVPQNRSGVRL